MTTQKEQEVIEAAKAWYQKVAKSWELPQGDKGVTYYREKHGESCEYDLYQTLKALLEEKEEV